MIRELPEGLFQLTTVNVCDILPRYDDRFDDWAAAFLGDEAAVSSGEVGRVCA